MYSTRGHCSREEPPRQTFWKTARQEGKGGGGPREPKENTTCCEGGNPFSGQRAVRECKTLNCPPEGGGGLIGVGGGGGHFQKVNRVKSHRQDQNI